MFLVPLGVLVASQSGYAAFTYTVQLRNDQEPSAVLTNSITGLARPASFGTATFTFNDSFTSLTMSASITNIDFTGSQTADLNDNLTNAHIHASATLVPLPQNTAGVVWGFIGSPQNDTNPADVVVTPFSGAGNVGGTVFAKWDPPEGNGTTLSAQIANLLAGRAYVNFHTTQNSGGEIRAFLTALPEPSSIVLLSFGAVAMAGYSWRSRKRSR